MQKSKQKLTWVVENGRIIPVVVDLPETQTGATTVTPQPKPKEKKNDICSRG